MGLNDFIEYEIDGCRCWWPGCQESLDAHLKDINRKRAESPHVVNQYKTGRQLKQSRAQNIRSHALSIVPKK